MNHLAHSSGALVLTMLLALTAGCQPKPIAMNEQEAQRVQQLTADMTPRCIGQHVVDLPRSFLLNSESSTEIDGVKVKVVPMQRAIFDVVLAGRKAGLESKKLPLNGLPHLRSSEAVDRNASIGLLFDRSESDASTSRLGRTLELIAWREGFRIDATINATDNTFPEDSKNNLAQQLSNDVSEKKAQLLSVFDRIRGRTDSEIPSEVGTCFPNGFVRGPMSDTQSITSEYDLEGSRDLFFLFALRADLRSEKSLLERSGQVEREMKPSGTQTIRKGQRDIGGLKFDEWLWKGPTPRQVPGTLFIAVANEKIASAQAPLVRAELFNGFSVTYPEDMSEEKKERIGFYKPLERASLSEAEAIAVWDKVSATIRPRRL
jgi:hypothetical protein